MAHAALVAKSISRGQGRSAVACAAYRAGDELTDERSGKVHNYRRKSGVEATGIEAPAHAPDWVHNRGQLWNAVEASETRINSRLAREVLLVLPRDLNAQQRAELVRGFAREAFVSEGMIADWAIHSPDAADGGKNYHAHIMLTTRRIEADGFGAKERAWNAKSELYRWRTLYEEHSNRQLEAAGSEYRVDLRSNAEKGIARKPQPKAGTAWNRLKRKAAWEAKRFDNPLRPERVLEDIQERFFEAAWGREWAWEGYDPALDPDKAWT